MPKHGKFYIYARNDYGMFVRFTSLTFRDFWDHLISISRLYDERDIVMNYDGRRPWWFEWLILFMKTTERI
jgi:hypothetical protein